MSVDVLQQIKLYLLAHSDVAQDRTRWIMGLGWDQTKWPGGQFPSAVGAAPPTEPVSASLISFLFTTKDDFEREPLLRGRFVLLARIDGHASWVSNAILSKLDNLPDEVPGGLIVRDKAGKPTGLSDSSLADCILPTL